MLNRGNMLTHDMTAMDAAVEVAEGIPGAVIALGALFRHDATEGLLAIYLLDDMNIRGSQVWAAFSKFYKGDAAKFLHAIERRDQELVKYLNDSASRYGWPWRAVQGGASRSADRITMTDPDPVDPTVIMPTAADIEAIG